MEKLIYDRDNYFIGENGVYIELQNTKEYIDKDGIKRIVIELKDQKKIDKVLELKQEKYEPIEVFFDEEVYKKSTIDTMPDVL